MEITPELLKTAKNRQRAALEHPSEISGPSKYPYALEGFVAQIAFEWMYPHAVSTGIDFPIARDYNYMLHKSRVKVKAEIVRKMPRNPMSLLTTISSYLLERNFDYFVFFAVKADLTQLWPLGWITKEDYFALAKFYKKGSPLPKNPSLEVAFDAYIGQAADLNGLVNIEGNKNDVISKDRERLQGTRNDVPKL